MTSKISAVTLAFDPIYLTLPMDPVSSSCRLWRHVRRTTVGHLSNRLAQWRTCGLWRRFVQSLKATPEYLNVGTDTSSPMSCWIGAILTKQGSQSNRSVDSFCRWKIHNPVISHKSLVPALNRGLAQARSVWPGPQAVGPAPRCARLSRRLLLRSPCS